MTKSRHQHIYFTQHLDWRNGWGQSKDEVDRSIEKPKGASGPSGSESPSAPRLLFREKEYWFSIYDIIAYPNINRNWQIVSELSEGHKRLWSVSTLSCVVNLEKFRRRYELEWRLISKWKWFRWKYEQI